MRKNREYRGILALFIVVLIGFVFTLGGNLADYLTGGDGKHSWYGHNGVIARLKNQSQPNLLAKELQQNTQVKNTPETDNSKNSSQLVFQPDQRYAPFDPSWLLKPAPAGALNITNFTTVDKQISCTITSDIQCVVNDFSSITRPGIPSAAKFVLTENNVTGPESTISANPSFDFITLPAGSSTVANGYACTGIANGIDCWNLKTGQGMTLTPNKANSYHPEIPKRKTISTPKPAEAEQNSNQEP